MSRRGWVIAAVIGVLVPGLIWIAGGRTPEDLDRRAAVVGCSFLLNLGRPFQPTCRGALFWRFVGR